MPSSTNCRYRYVYINNKQDWLKKIKKWVFVLFFYRPATIPKISRDTLQRFVFEDGYIACSANRGLVLGLLEQEGRVSQVLLVKRRPDDINQRWIMKENG